MCEQSYLRRHDFLSPRAPLDGALQDPEKPSVAFANLRALRCARGYLPNMASLSNKGFAPLSGLTAKPKAKA